MTTPAPTVTDHDDFERQLLELRKREKAHTREGDAIAAARRRLPMTDVPPGTTVIGPDGPVRFGDVFDGRDELVVYSHMFYDGEPWEWQCEGCTRNSWNMGDAADAAYLNANGITFAFLGDGPYEEIAAFRDFMGYTAPWYSIAHLDDPTVGVAGRISCYLRREHKIYLMYWTTGRGDEVMSPSFGLLDMTAYGRREMGGLARGVAAVPDPLFLAHRRARGADGAQKRRSTGAPVDAPGRHRGRRTDRVALPEASEITMADTTAPLPPVVDRDTRTAQVNERPVRETAHTGGVRAVTTAGAFPTATLPSDGDTLPASLSGQVPEQLGLGPCSSVLSSAPTVSIIVSKPVSLVGSTVNSLVSPGVSGGSPTGAGDGWANGTRSRILQREDVNVELLARGWGKALTWQMQKTVDNVCSDQVRLDA